ncbi:hypothetical protein GWI33_010372 [Rhynchophorus ferrugineus]|uniref:Uncharacterized protein n=1 Tax=Rhynchophorus ferrugineus TaxID=354439 RepID=A0A834MFG3_RHYFE|nr:hypothetical protein GWI33_010372 [Rhynchophorus ferrugineus]
MNSFIHHCVDNCCDLYTASRPNLFGPMSPNDFLSVHSSIQYDTFMFTYPKATVAEQWAVCERKIAILTEGSQLHVRSEKYRIIVRNNERSGLFLERIGRMLIPLQDDG